MSAGRQEQLLLTESARRYGGTLGENLSTTDPHSLSPLLGGDHIDLVIFSVSEIKLLFRALAGCTSHKTVHPEIHPCTLPIYSNDKRPQKRAHTGCTPPKIVHPAVEMCTPGAGCTLNFGHC